MEIKATNWTFTQAIIYIDTFE